MTDNWKWLIALILPIVIAMGGNYGLNMAARARIDERLQNVESSVDGIELINKVQSDSILENKMQIHDVSAGWKLVSEAVKANTAQLTRFTEVLIRMEEREKLSAKTNLKNEK